MRRTPPPLSVTRPSPSRTTRDDVLTTFAVRSRVIVTGSGPHEKRMSPPLATARTTLADVHEDGVPLPTTVSATFAPAGRGGREASVSTPLAPAGRADATTAATAAATSTPARVTAP